MFYLKGNKNQAMFSYIMGRGIHMLQSSSYGPLEFLIELYVPGTGGRSLIATSGRTGIRYMGSKCRDLYYVGFCVWFTLQHTMVERPRN